VSIHAAVKDYLTKGYRVVPLYGVSPDGVCLCGHSSCKPRDAGKHEPPDTNGKWKADPPEIFDDRSFSSFDNVALAMGPWRQGKWLTAIDLDGMGSSFDEIGVLARLGPLPQTLTAKSPRGLHMVYWVPEFTPLGNWVDVFQTKPGASVDIRYARGRIVVAPSRGATGSYYWIDDREPVQLPQQAIDAVLHERIQRGLPVLERWDRSGKAP
jgi:hypothetical protein